MQNYEISQACTEKKFIRSTKIQISSVFHVKINIYHLSSILCLKFL